MGIPCPSSRWLLAAVIACAGCVSTTTVDLTGYRHELGFPVSADAVPEGCEPVAALAYERTGFYVFGALPIVHVELASGVKRLVKEAREHGATGIANLDYTFKPASSLRFVVFPLPDWSASLNMTATAYAPVGVHRSPQPALPQAPDAGVAAPGR